MSQGGLTRSRQALLGGVLAGIAQRLGWSVSGTRVAFVILTLVTLGAPGVVLYLLLWLILPQE